MADVTINLDQSHPKAVGSPVYGSMVLKLGKPQPVQRIQLRIVGDCITRDFQGVRKKEVVDSERILETWLDLFVSPNSGGEVEKIFQPGAFKYPFEFLLPEECPGTICGPRKGAKPPHFQIDYSIEAVVDLSTEESVSKAANFNIFECLNLKTFPDWVSEPCSNHKETSLGGAKCSGSQGTVNCSIILYKLYFVAGDTIQVTVNLTNESQWILGQISVSLQQNVKFFVNKQERDFAHKLVKEEICQQVPMNSTRTLNVTLKIPEEIGSSTVPDSKRKIRISYAVVVEVCGRGLFASSQPHIVNSQEIVISTLPFKKN